MKLRSMKHQKGQALLEGALVLPLLFTFTFGMIDTGRVLYAINTANNIARDEVTNFARDPRLSAGHPQAQEQRTALIESFRQKVRARLANTGGIDATETAVRVRMPADTQKDPVQVQITHSVRLLSTLFFPRQFRQFDFMVESASFIETPSPTVSHPELLDLISADLDGDGIPNSLDDDIDGDGRKNSVDTDPYKKNATCQEDIKSCSGIDACKVYKDDASCSAGNGVSADDACRYSKSKSRCQEASYEVACKYGGNPKQYCRNAYDICTINGNKNLCSRAVYCEVVGGCSEKEVQCLVKKECSRQEYCTLDSTSCTAKERCDFGLTCTAKDKCNAYGGLFCIQKA